MEGTARTVAPVGGAEMGTRQMEISRLDTSRQSVGQSWEGLAARLINRVSNAFETKLRRLNFSLTARLFLNESRSECDRRLVGG